MFFKIVPSLCNKKFHTFLVLKSKTKFIKDISKLSKDEKYDLIKKKYIVKDKKVNTTKSKPCLIWQCMSLNEISESMQKPISEVFEIMSYIKGLENFKHPFQRIDDIKIINQIYKSIQKKTIVIKDPKVEIVQEIVKFQDFVKQPDPDPTKLRKRCPVVVIIGHVDHGKTTLLDKIRKTSMVDKEFGGITQHIGAFTAKLDDQPLENNLITFVDTPGHAAFASMRSRGCRLTDIAILVVAADDSVMEQTIQSIRFANECKVPIIVAINKIDKEKSDIEKVKRDLSGFGVTVEDYGGDIQAVPISALKATNIDQLLEAIMAEAEILNIKADYEGLVEGVIIESKIDKNRGVLCSAIIHRGTLSKGDILLSLPASSPINTIQTQETASQLPEHTNQLPMWARVRAMFDQDGRTLHQVTPGLPVEIVGWKSSGDSSGGELPAVGSTLYQVENEDRAKEIIRFRTDLEKVEKLENDWKIIDLKRKEHLVNYKKDLEMKKALKFKNLPKSLSSQQYDSQKEEDNLSLLKANKPRFSIILKADVMGSVEAILDILQTFDETRNHCSLNILHYGIGPVTDFDIELVETFKGVIYTFNIGDDNNKHGKHISTRIKNHKIIYKLLDDLVQEMTQIMPLLDKEEILGEARVHQEFVITEGKNKVRVAGCMVENGFISKKCDIIHVIRADNIIYRGKIRTLKHFKTEVDSISKNNECGLSLEDDNGIEYKPGDIIKSISIKKITPKIQWDMGF